MLQTTLWFIENRGLFSNHYLNNQLLILDEWKEPNNIEEIFSKIKALYQGKQLLFPNAKESQLREDFLNPVLKYLGHYYKVEGKTEGTSRFPDYGLFSDEKSADDAVKYQGTEDFYKKAIAICEAKAWEIKLDERDPRNIEPDKRTPNSQIDDYLRWSEKKWGILTNGRFWRLYYRENSYRNYFYQVDLAEIIEKDDVKAFKYFFLFFRKEAFDVDVNNICFLDRVYQGSVDYAKDIGKNLEENVYKAMKTLAEGFINWGESNLTKTEEDLKVIQENTMILLYRLLFIFFAEAEGLLDISQKNPASKNYTEHYSLDSLKKKIKNKIKSREDIPAYLDSYYNQLQTLFDFIDNGTEASGIPKEKLYIPSYNGGLFDAKKNSFLSEKKIGDYYLAKAIDLLASSEGKKPEEKGFIDYSSLDIRHLGSIYEGLLEYKLKLATEPMVAVKEKGKEKWIPESEFKGKKYIDRADKDEIYLATDKGERKATGSYYTPEYIVKYIVENTLIPIVNEKMNNAIKNNNKCSDAILSIKVLDPAMGSGHFLVEAVDFLGHHLGDAINKDIERGLINEWEYSDDWLRREIVSHCIYGVDLNLMAVELAKVSLWLKTISKDKPLSFLDHRLKCGNSLIGCNLVDLPWYPELKKKKIIRKERRLDIPEGFINKLVDTIKKISVISDETLDNIKKKEEIFNDFKNTMEYDMIKTLADVRTSIYFGNQIEKQTYGVYSGDAYHSSESEWKGRREKWFAQKGREIAENKHFFHWELEFPEIFFEEGKIKENSGFDVVIGNPPWVTLRGKQRMGVSDEEVNYYLDEFKDSAEYKVNSFALFVDKSIELMKNKAEFSFIIPSTILTNEYLSKIRKKVLSKTHLKKVLDLGNRVFGEGVADSIIILFEKQAAVSLEQGVEVYTQIKDLKNNIYEVKNIAQKEYLESDGFVVNVNIGKTDISLFKKVESSSVGMKEIIKNYVGIVTGDNKKFISSKKLDLRYKEILIGKDLGRYNYNFNSRYVLFDKEQLWSNTDESIFRLQEKILLRKTGNILIACIDKNQFYTEQTIYNLFPRTKTDISLKFILTLINSKLMQYYFYNKLITNPKAYPYIKGVHIDLLPIRSIFFTTPKTERKSLVENLQTKCQNNKFAEVLAIVDECLPKDRKGNFITEKEKSDVVHDFLAFLTEQMIKMNKEKNKEIQNFLDWLQREIKAKIGQLTNRTKLKEYYNLKFDEFLEILKKSKKKIPINLLNREFQTNLKKEFDESISKLNPLIEKIECTDNLIDQIVYKLYGLTDDEIKIVEDIYISKKNK